MNELQKIIIINGVEADGLDLLTLYDRVYNKHTEKILFIRNGSKVINIITA